ncbi:MAG: Y-family DNA polymerase [Chromatiales bacterium]
MHPRTMAIRPATALPSRPADSRNTAPYASSSGLWLALHLPQLPLEAHTRSSARSIASVVSTAEGGQARVLCADALAAQAGVYPGLAVSAAHALVAGLRVYRRDPQAERAALEKLATLGITYTPVVSLAPPLAVLLEIEGSLRLFGGAERLLQRLHGDVRRFGYTCSLAAAPAPLGAELLACAGRTLIVREQAALRAALSSLPVSVLGLPEAAHLAMREIGVRSLSDLLRLPRAGLARRFGTAPVEALDRALGHRADPRSHYQPPVQFKSLLHFPEPVADAEALLFSARRQLLEFAAFLEVRCAGARTVEWRLYHWRAMPSVIRIESVQLHRNARRFLDLLRERLHRQPLPAAVESIELQAVELEPYEPDTAHLFAGALREEAQTRGLLIERLRARLGNEAVHGFELHADHRPEYAFRKKTISSPSKGEDKVGGRALQKAELSHPHPHLSLHRGKEISERPLWLLQAPAPLTLSGTRPQWQGQLRLESGPERIEGGWWDHCPIARDYFIARNPQGARLWVFRERYGARRWFLHGLFS